MLRSRSRRALIAIGAGIIGAGSVVCATMALTHPSHATPRLASLAPVSGVAAAPEARSSATGLLAWHAPPVPAPVALRPRVVRPVRVVVFTRRVKRSAAPVRPRTNRTTRARSVSAPRARPERGDAASRDSRTTESSRRRESMHRDTTGERASGDDEHRSRDPEPAAGDREREDDG